MQQVGDADLGHHRIEDAVVTEEVAHQQQRDELGHRDGDNEQGAPQFGELGLFVVDEHGQEHAAEEVGEGGEERPHQRPDQDLAECIAEGQGQGLPAAEQRKEVGQAHPGEQGVGRHMLLIVVGEGYRNEDEKRYDGEDHHAQHRQSQKGNVKLFVQIDPHILCKAVGLAAGLADHLQVIVGGYHSHRRCQHRHDDHHGDDAQKQDGERVIVVVDLVLEGDRVEHHLHLDCAQRTKFHQVGDASHPQIIQSQTLHQCDQDRLDQLAVTDVAKAPDQEGQFGENVAVDKAVAKFLQEVGFFAVRAPRLLKHHLRHSDHSFRAKIISNNQARQAA